MEHSNDYSVWPALLIMSFIILLCALSWASGADVARHEARQAGAAENAALQHENAWLIKQLELCGCGES